LSVNRLPRVSVAAIPHTQADEISHEPFTPSGMSVAQILAIMVSYWKQTLLIIVAAILLTLAVIKFLPKSYTATATLIVNSNMKDPLAGQEFQEGSVYNYVQTQTELILSPIVLLPVIDKLNLVEDQNFVGLSGTTNSKAQREIIENKLSTNLDVQTGRGGHLIYISTTARDPVMAAQIVNTVADVYISQERGRVNDPAGERAQRYSEQLAELRAKASAAQDKVAEFRKKNGITDVTASDSGTEILALHSLEGKLVEAQTARRATESNVTDPSADDSSGTAQALRSQISAQEIQLAQLSSTLGPQHPKVLELKSQMAASRRALAAEVTSENTSARELESKLAAAVAEQRLKVLHLREQQDEGAKLSLELESAQSVYKRALDGYDQILFASVGNYSNVSLINRAVPPLKASKPNKLKLLALGIIAGLGLGLLAPLFYELLFHRRVRCADDIERQFGIPILAKLDALPAPTGTQ
jgi:succinoglycan biosynthesis transport protein ExoP